MSIFFRDPQQVRYPPEDVRFKSIRIDPTNDGRRVKIKLSLTPFLQRPNLELTISSPNGVNVAHTIILESMLSELEFYMHIKEPEPGLEYRLVAEVYYQNIPQASTEPEDIDLPERLIVDQTVTSFLSPWPATGK